VRDLARPVASPARGGRGPRQAAPWWDSVPSSRHKWLWPRTVYRLLRNVGVLMTVYWLLNIFAGCGG